MSTVDLKEFVGDTVRCEGLDSCSQVIENGAVGRADRWTFKRRTDTYLSEVITSPNGYVWTTARFDQVGERSYAHIPRADGVPPQPTAVGEALCAALTERFGLGLVLAGDPEPIGGGFGPKSIGSNLSILRKVCGGRLCCE